MSWQTLGVEWLHLLVRPDITAAGARLSVEWCLMSTVRRIRLRIRGRVQGVYYRAHARTAAMRLGLRGWIRNCDDGAVEVVVEGLPAAVEAFIAWCHQGSPAARVDRLEVTGETDAVALASSFDVVF